MMTIELTNVGRIERAIVPHPEGGGVVLFRGKNGTGKTTALEAIEAVATGKPVQATVTDGQKSGRIECHGITVTLGKSNRRSGELEATTLDAKYSLADLVDPGIADPVAADSKRIKSLVSMSGRDARAALTEFVGGGEEIDELVPDINSAKHADPIVAAGAVKRAIEAKAREWQKRAEAATATVEAIDVSLDGFTPLGAPRPDLQALHTQATDAALAVRDITAQRDDVVKAQAALAKRRMAWTPEMQQEMNDGLVEEEIAVCSAAIDNIVQRITSLQTELNWQRSALVRLRARQSVGDARRLEFEQIEAAENELAAMPCPSNQELIDATEVAKAAQEAYSTAVVVNEKWATWEKREAAFEKARNASLRADSLREMANGVNGVLTNIVGTLGTDLYVNDGRLCLETDRGETFFGELSHGERWKLAIDMGLSLLGPKCILILEQEAWEGLDPETQNVVREHAKLRQVTIYTAEATNDEEFVAVEFEGNAL